MASTTSRPVVRTQVSKQSIVLGVIPEFRISNKIGGNYMGGGEFRVNLMIIPMSVSISEAYESNQLLCE